MTEFGSGFTPYERMMAERADGKLGRTVVIVDREPLGRFQKFLHRLAVIGDPLGELDADGRAVRRHGITPTHSDRPHQDFSGFTTAADRVMQIRAEQAPPPPEV